MLQERRHHRNRIIQRFYFRLKSTQYRTDQSTIEDHNFSIKHSAVLSHKHRAKCSCWMCGNPRRHFGHRTLQELKQFDQYRDSVAEFVFS